MIQTTFFDVEALPLADKIVNVANVLQRSPFRYPGGKTWLVPRLRQWLANQAVKPREFVEPFAGGGIASLTTACEGLANLVTMVERDEQVAAVCGLFYRSPAAVSGWQNGSWSLN